MAAALLLAGCAVCAHAASVARRTAPASATKASNRGPAAATANSRKSVSSAVVASQVSAGQPDLAAILDRMEQAQAAAHAQNAPYTVTRSYRFFASDAEKPNSEVLAKVDFKPPTREDFAITQGSGETAKIVKQVLQHESDMGKNPGQGVVSRANYDFELLRTEKLNGVPCYVLALRPKHESKEAVRGQAWVDANSYLIRHVEGELAKSPSWWVKDVHVAMDYERIAGIWLQIEMQAVANVRLIGKHTMLAQNLALSVASPMLVASSGVAPHAGTRTTMTMPRRSTSLPVMYAAFGQPAVGTRR